MRPQNFYSLWRDGFVFRQHRKPMSINPALAQPANRRRSGRGHSSSIWGSAQKDGGTGGGSGRRALCPMHRHGDFARVETIIVNLD